MLKKIMITCLFLVSFVYSESAHSGLTATNIHTPYRWLFADSAARVNQSVTAADTMKLAYQRSDSTSWVLVSTTGTKWRRIARKDNEVFKSIISDTIANTGGISTARLTTTGNSYFTGSILGQTVSGTPYRFHATGDGYGGGTTIFNVTTDADSSGNFVFFKCIADYNGTPKTTMSLTANGAFEVLGNITTLRYGGFGTTTPQYPLHVVGSTKTDSLTFGQDFLKVYDTGSFPCTLSTAYVTVQQVGVIKYTVIGNQVTLRIPSLTGTSAGDWGSQGEIKCGSAPSIITSCDSITIPAVLYSGNSLASREVGEVSLRNGFVSIFYHRAASANWPTTGTVGWFRRTSLTYTKY